MCEYLKTFALFRPTFLNSNKPRGCCLRDRCGKFPSLLVENKFSQRFDIWNLTPSSGENNKIKET